MKHLVEFPLENGSSIVVEVNELETVGTVRAARGDKIEQAKQTLEDALNKVLPAAKSVVEKLRNMESRPNEVEVTFGVNLSTIAGAFIASVSAEANFGVTVRWSDKTKDAEKSD